MIEIYIESVRCVPLFITYTNVNSLTFSKLIQEVHFNFKNKKMSAKLKMSENNLFKN